MRGLELPSQVACDTATLTATYGKFVAEPFERGFGVTIGNSLRRILLSSLEGSAITRIKLHVAQHEFTTLPGVVEDVTDIVLNVKSLIVKNSSAQTRVLRIEKNTKGAVTGADIRTDEAVEVINKGHVLATLTDDVPFLMELVVENGRGYVPATEHSPQIQEIGIIPVDAAFSPCIRVRYEVEETRVGQKTNYDRLTLEIWTNGSIAPEMALVEAGKILRKHLNPFVQYNELGGRVHSEVREAATGGIDPALEAKLAMSLAEAEPVGAGDQLPGVGEHQHRPRPGQLHRGPVVGGPQLRRDHAQRGPRQAGRHRPAFGHEAPAGAHRSFVGRYSRHICDTEDEGASSAAIPTTTALRRNLASALILTERRAEGDGVPKVKGRIITTLQKAKEVRPLVEKCVTIARKALPHLRAADAFASAADRNSDQWKAWRHSDRWQQWSRAMAPVVTARRRVLVLLGDKKAVKILFDEIAPRFEDRPGGYTRVLHLAKPRLGDAGPRAILEFVGKHDRVRREAAKPSFEAEEPEVAAAETPEAESPDVPTPQEDEAPQQTAEASS